MRSILTTSPTSNSVCATERVFRNPPPHLANLFGYALISAKLSTPAQIRVTLNTASVIPASVTPTRAQGSNVIGRTMKYLRPRISDYLHLFTPNATSSFYPTLRSHCNRTHAARRPVWLQPNLIQRCISQRHDHSKFK